MEWGLIGPGSSVAVTEQSTQSPVAPQENRHHHTFWKDQIQPAGVGWWEEDQESLSDLRTGRLLPTPVVRTGTQLWAGPF